jgi:hypothetical protein
MSERDWSTATAVLRLSTRLVDEIQAGVINAGFHDVTPLHGFAFARIAAGTATAAELGAHLAISKQAADGSIPTTTERSCSTSPIVARPAPGQPDRPRSGQSRSGARKSTKATTTRSNSR